MQFSEIEKQYKYAVANIYFDANSREMTIKPIWLCENKEIALNSLKEQRDYLLKTEPLSRELVDGINNMRVIGFLNI